MPDAIDELIARSKTHPQLRAFHKFHKQHPEVLDFLIQEIQIRIDHGFKAFSVSLAVSVCALETRNGEGAR